MAVQGHMRRSDQVAVQYSFAPVEVCAMNEKLPWRNIIGYSLGDVANNFAFAMGALFLLSYYTDVAGVGAAAAGAVLLGVRIFVQTFLPVVWSIA